MSGKAQNPQAAQETAHKRRATNLAAQKSAAQAQSVDPVLLQRAITDPAHSAPADVLALQHTMGNRAVNELIQAKLTLSPAGDQYEQEADRVAEQVMTMPNSHPQQASGAQASVQRTPEEEDELQMKPLAASITPQVQRAPEEEEELQMKPLIQRAAEEEEEEELQAKPEVQRASSGAGFEVGDDFEQQLAASRGGGSPLPAEVRSFMEPRFGADFSGVRIHTDSQAAQLNRSVSAQAFTHDSDIYLGEGKSDVQSAQGRQLLAHELTHVIQQSGVQQQSQQKNLMMNTGLSVQRHPVGTELPDKNTQVIEIGEKEKKTPEKIGKDATLAPEATRTNQVEMAEKKAGKEAGTAFTKSQKLTPGAMSLASAEKILQGAYGGLKKIVPGTIVILADQPACSAKYDEVCIADGILHEGVPWQPGDCAIDDAAAGVSTEGFAWKGVVYVNGATTLVTATAHEILHNNAVSNFRSTVGETFNEGVTETLARKALTDAGVKVPSVTAYSAQVNLTKMLVDLVGIDVVEKGYFENVQELVRMYNRKGSSTWKKAVEAAEALDTEKLKIALKRGFGA